MDEPDFSDDEIEAALRANDGIQLAAAKALSKMSGQTVERAYVNEAIRRSERLQRACREAEEANLDMAEAVLLRAIMRGRNVSATKFYLETKGKVRGYNRKQILVTMMDPRRLSEAELTKAIGELEALTLDRSEYREVEDEVGANGSAVVVGQRDIAVERGVIRRPRETR